MATAGSVWIRLGIKSQSLVAGAVAADAALEKIRKSGEKTTKTLKEVGTALSVKVALPLVLVGGLATKTAIDFDDAMRQVQAVTSATGEDFVLLTDLARDLGSTTSFSAKQAAEGMIFLGRAGFSVNQIFGTIDDTLNLARSTTTDLGTSADILTNIMTAFKIPASDATRAVDVLAATTASSNTDLVQLGDAMKYVGTVARPLGWSLEQTAAAAGLLSNVGIQASMAGTSLRQVLTSLASPTSIAKKTLTEYGLTVEDVNPVTNEFTDILRTLNDAGVDIVGTMEIFGLRGGPGMAELLAQGKTSLNEYITTLENTQGAADRMAKTMDAGAGGAVRMLKSALEGLSIEFGTIISEGLVPAANAAQKIAVAFTNLPDPVKKIIVAFSGLAVAVSGLTLAIGVITPLVASGGVLATGFATLSGAAATVAAGISAISLPLVAVGAGAVYLEKRFKFFSSTLVILTDFIKTKFIPAISEKVTAAFDRMKPRIDAAIESLRTIWEGFVKFTGIDSSFLDDWAAKADAIRQKNEAMKLGLEDDAAAVGALKDEINGLGSEMDSVSDKIPGFAGHTRELIEAGMPEQAGFVGGMRDGIRLPGYQEPATPSLDFRQFSTSAAPRSVPGLQAPSIDMTTKETEQNTKKIEENTKDLNASTLENGTLIFQASSDIQKAIRESKSTRTVTFFRGSPT